MGECLSRQEAFEKMNQNVSKCQEHNRAVKVVAVQEKIATSLEKIIKNQELALKNAKMDANLFEHMFESLLGDADSDSEEEESSTSDKRSKKSRLFHAILGIEKNMEGIEKKMEESQVWTRHLYLLNKVVQVLDEVAKGLKPLPEMQD